MSLPPLHVQSDRFMDAHGRQVLLRGVNLGGDCKLPYPSGGTQYPTDFSDHREVSFVGRPFPLAQADTHLARLRRWGFNCLRLLTSWEAVEHAGPGLYDEAYLEYFTELCRKAGEHGFYVFVDFHQDVWSRMSGGDGAPGWTFESVGLDFEAFDAADAALVMQHRFRFSDESPHQAAYPQMSWPLNYRLPANAIMWTLFWAGRTVTPEFHIQGQNVQDYLQGRYFDAVEQLASRVRTLPHVIGFDVLNEPGLGWLGQPLSTWAGPPIPGPALSPLAALAVARGKPTEVPVIPMGTMRLLNAAGRSIWRDGAECPFERAGIYRVEDGELIPLAEQAFQTYGGRALDITEDVFAPFFTEAAARVRRHREDWLLMAEMDPFGTLTGRHFPARMPEQSVNASHWYDLALLLTKTFDPRVSVDPLTGERTEGPAALCERYVRQLGRLKALASAFPGGAPTLIGEFGIPYDLDNGQAYAAWASGQRDVFGPHTQALELMYEAMDALLLSSTQWNYTAGNRNDLRIGDQWNQEDLSIFSIDQIDDPLAPDAGGRAVAGFARPYAATVQGQLQSMHFSRHSGTFVVEYEADATVHAPTELVLPPSQFPAGVEIVIVGPARRCEDDATPGLARFLASMSGKVRIACHRKAAPNLI
ncbi:glycoside hydrolase family 5 protein [Comamonas thiooxydans]|uniref:glycoside hydrolase family 5 protein n=1 Tax=Comamonas thiooxydans TaxID=363952 RepID=UPI00057B6C23|nr:cellulase family glycosylhydrolase [Comamonas thiooxydans]